VAQAILTILNRRQDRSTNGRGTPPVRIDVRDHDADVCLGDAGRRGQVGALVEEELVALPREDDERAPILRDFEAQLLVEGFRASRVAHEDFHHKLLDARYVAAHAVIVLRSPANPLVLATVALSSGAISQNALITFLPVVSVSIICW